MEMGLLIKQLIEGNFDKYLEASIPHWGVILMNISFVNKAI
jgi:hypothetical protein